MTRAEKTVVGGIVMLVAYETLLMKLVPLPQKVQTEIVPVLPFVALVWFGAYLLFKLGWGVFTFNDVPEAHKELMGQIDLARKDLQSKGLVLD